jgi:small subunit ribosomal protein S19e
MTTIYDVPSQRAINEIAEELKKYEEVKPPTWANYVKTSAHKERAPYEPAEVWWYQRCASLLRKIYMNGPIGINRLKNMYGGRKNRGAKPFRYMKGSGSIIRKALQQLENAGLLEVRDKKGRVLSNTAVSVLDRIAHQIKLDLQKEIVDLKKY